MIYYNIPWSSDGNLGKAYNLFMELIPNDDDFACFIDGDAMFLHKTFGKQLEDIIEKHKEYSLFTAMTNRVKFNKQVLGKDWYTDDISIHRKFQEELLETSYDKVEDISTTAYGLMSGVMILIKKSLWKKVGGFTDGFLGVDNDIHAKAIEKGEKVGLMSGVYLYHWYRGGEKTYSSSKTKRVANVDTDSPMFARLLERQKIYDERRRQREQAKKKKIIYSAITGDYAGDDTAPHWKIPEGWEYRLYSNRSDVNATHIVENKGLSDTKLARYIKIMPWDFFDFDVCIWIDGNTSYNIEEAIKLANQYDFVISKHPMRSCIYDEAEAIKQLGKESSENIDRVIERYRQEGYPENNGMVASHAIIRRNTLANRQFCELWWDEVRNNSKRDQMSFNYVLWKNPIDVHYIQFKTVFKTHNIHRGLH